MSTEDRLLTAKEAAEVLGVSTDFFYRNRRWEMLPFTVYISERRIRFSLTKMLKWIEERSDARSGVFER
jgi:predicted DNA-binding transcriptional regulator AlpA